MFFIMPVSGTHTIFLNSRGIRAGWRVLIFAAIYLFCLSLIGIAAPRFAHPRFISLTAAPMLFREVVAFAVALLAALIMSIIEGRSFADYLLPPRLAFSGDFWRGALWGWVALTALLLLLRAGHGFSFGRVALSGWSLFDNAVLWALVFVVVGLSEEFTFRGYALYTLTTGMGFWPAALVLSAAFGALHLGNPGEDWVGALAAALIGLFFCFTVRRTGTLWLAVGLHAGWDYAETFLYSVPNSGLVATGHLLRSSFHGPAWLTGGAVGPEGSALVFAVIAALFIVFDFLYPHVRFPQAPDKPPASVSDL
jgi:uncharacterized protein